MENIYLLYGQNIKLIKETEKKLIEESKADEFNISFYDMEENLIQDAVNDLYSIPFMSDYRVVVISNFYLLSASKPKKELDHIMKRFEEYIENPSRTSVLIIEAPYEKLDSRKAIYKELSTKSKMIECKIPTKEEKESYIRRSIERNNLRIDRDALLELCKRLDKDPLIISNELEKLFLYAKDKKNITLEMVDLIISKYDDDNVYDLVNAVVAKDTKRALEIYYEFLASNIDSLGVLQIVTQKFQEILYTKELITEGRSYEEITKYFSVTKGRSYYMMKNAKEISYTKLKNYLERLTKLDFEIKSGKIDKNIGIELFLLNL